jgi:ketosteroid isomerase-like protein
MTEQRNLEVVRRGYDAFLRGDVEGVLAVFDEGSRWVSPGPPDLPTSGQRQGIPAARDFFRALNEILDIQRFEAKTFVTQGDHVVVLGEDTVRVKATGKILDEAWVHAFVLKNDKVVAFQEYFDTAAIVAELRSAAART